MKIKEKSEKNVIRYGGLESELVETLSVLMYCEQTGTKKVLLKKLKLFCEKIQLQNARKRKNSNRSNNNRHGTYAI